MENSKGHTILIVDDEPDILEFLSYNIRKEGFKVFVASNGHCAAASLLVEAGADVNAQNDVLHFYS